MFLFGEVVFWGDGLLVIVTVDFYMVFILLGRVLGIFVFYLYDFG